MATTGSEISYEQDNNPSKKTPSGWKKYWQQEKSAAEKRLRKYKKQGNQIVRRYKDERDGHNDFQNADGKAHSKLNLFYTNVKTKQDMLFGSTPKIDVAREHHDPDDDVARIASLMFQRMLEADIYPSGDDLSTTLKACLQDRLLPGMGMARVRYEYKTTPKQQTNPDTLQVETVQALSYEGSPCDYVHWQDVLWGWGRTWTEIPWLAYRSWLTKDEATARFGEDKAKNLQYENQLPTGDENKDETYETENKNNVQKAEIWEFWSKSEQKVFWYNDGCDVILDKKDDPLELDGFFPSPMPMMANLTTTLFVPRADFIMAQDLYNEIDELQSRITTITRAVKVVGVYDKGSGDSVGRMLKEGVENDLIPVDNWAMFAEKGGLAGTVQWFPVQEVVNTLQTLRQVLSEQIELLYQVTGMSDILRGANTDQYTSDGTNQLKAKFGSIRIQALQDEFARFAADLEALKAEVISKHFSPESIIRQSSAEFLPAPDRDKIGAAVRLMQDPSFKWRVDIKPESIAMVDYAQLKSERSEFLTSMATYLQSAGAMVQSVPGSLPVLLEMLKWGMAGFKGSNYLEGIMDQAIDMAKTMPPPGQDDGKAQADAAKGQLELEKMRMQHQNAMQLNQAKTQGQLSILSAKLQTELQKMATDMQNDIAKDNQASVADLQKIQEEFMADMKLIQENLSADLTLLNQQSSADMAELQMAHNHKMTEQSNAMATMQQNPQADSN
ncbi:MAG: hypothetical protein KAI25_03875 [Hyphomicrobiaceae bacterium]|nr:hypothetical protein [Hyphomicrobiaceae bacterium]